MASGGENRKRKKRTLTVPVDDVPEPLKSEDSPAPQAAGAGRAMTIQSSPPVMDDEDGEEGETSPEPESKGAPVTVDLDVSSDELAADDEPLDEPEELNIDEDDIEELSDSSAPMPPSPPVPVVPAARPSGSTPAPSSETPPPTSRRELGADATRELISAAGDAPQPVSKAATAGQSIEIDIDDLEFTEPQPKPPAAEASTVEVPTVDHEDIPIDDEACERPTDANGEQGEETAAVESAPRAEETTSAESPSPSEPLGPELDGGGEEEDEDEGRTTIPMVFEMVEAQFGDGLTNDANVSPQDSQAPTVSPEPAATAADAASQEPDVAAAEPAAPSEPEAAPSEPEAAASEPEEASSKAEASSPDPEATAPELEVPSLEPKPASPEPEAVASPEPEASKPEATPESVVVGVIQVIDAGEDDEVEERAAGSDEVEEEASSGVEVEAEPDTVAEPSAVEPERDEEPSDELALGPKVLGKQEGSLDLEVESLEQEERQTEPGADEDEEQRPAASESPGREEIPSPPQGTAARGGEADAELDLSDEVEVIKDASAVSRAQALASAVLEELEVEEFDEKADDDEAEEVDPDQERVESSAAPPPPPKSEKSTAASPPAPAPPPPPKGVSRRKRRKSWWEEMFNDDYLRSLPDYSKRQTQKEVDFIESALGIKAGGMILDLACGNGRHAVALSSRGYQIVGLDLSLPMLARAAELAQKHNQKINFIHGDMRYIAFESTFDGVCCLGTSFGYFDDETNIKVIEGIHKSLKARGMLVIEVSNRDFIIVSQPNMIWFEGDGCVCMEESSFNYITSRLKVKRTLLLEGGRQVEHEFTIRLYCLHELGKILHNAGFRVIEVSGHIHTPGAFFGTESQNLIILAEKRAE